LPGSGILFDLGSHLIDQAIDLFDLPNEIYAVYNDKVKCIGFHEDAHIISYNIAVPLHLKSIDEESVSKA